MTYKLLKYIHDLAFGRQSCLQRVRKFSVKVWHSPESYNFVCGCNIEYSPEYLLCLLDSEIPKALFFSPLTSIVSTFQSNL